jgi:hypothetical protein
MAFTPAIPITESEPKLPKILVYFVLGGNIIQESGSAVNADQ